MKEKFILLADDVGDVSSAGMSRSQLIRDLAAEFCRRLRLPLRILYVSSAQKYFLKKSQKEKLKRIDRQALELLGREMSHYPVKTKIIFTQGDPVQNVLDQEKKGPPLEMVVVGSQGKRGLKKAIIGSVSEEILRSSIVPVLILGPEARANKYELPMEDPIRILVLTDLSSASLPAEEYATALALRLGARMTLCHSVGHQIHQLKEMVASRRISGFGIDAMFEDMRKDADKLLQKKLKLAEKRQVNVDSLMLKDEKNIEDILPKKVGDAYDLVVMGTHTRGKVLTAFIGSSARNLILKCPVPVLICRSYSG